MASMLDYGTRLVSKQLSLFAATAIVYFQHTQRNRVKFSSPKCLKKDLVILKWFCYTYSYPNQTHSQRGGNASRVMGQILFPPQDEQSSNSKQLELLTRTESGYVPANYGKIVLQTASSQYFFAVCSIFQLRDIVHFMAGPKVSFVSPRPNYARERFPSLSPRRQKRKNLCTKPLKRLISLRPQPGTNELKHFSLFLKRLRHVLILKTCFDVANIIQLQNI